MCSAGELAEDSEADWSPFLLSPSAEQSSLALPPLHPLPAQSQCHSAVQASPGRGQVSSAASHSFSGDPPMPPPTRRGRATGCACIHAIHPLCPLNGLLQSHPAPHQAAATLPPNSPSSWVPVHLHLLAKLLPLPRIRASRHLRVNPASPSVSISPSLRWKAPGT